MSPGFFLVSLIVSIGFISRRPASASAGGEAIDAVDGGITFPPGEAIGAVEGGIFPPGEANDPVGGEAEPIWDDGLTKDKGFPENRVRPCRPR